ncbi:MAG: CCA tRNA nucleotidyltransferase [Eubacteriales bacterium]
MVIKLPKNVTKIIKTFHTSGYEAYAVGGCIRDTILGREPEDWDITTSAKPEDMKKLFKRTIDTGIEHGTVTIMIGSEGYEVTTYRIDGEYVDHRRPKEVTFTSNLMEDLKRRDFTINAMAYNEENGLIDIFGGIEDIKARVIRCVGDPRQRFDEDALRIMRAVRFAAQLNYAVEEETKRAMCEYSSALETISEERIQVELVKTVTSDNPGYLELAYETNVMTAIMPEFDAIMHTTQNNPHHCYDVGHHTLWAMKSIGNHRWLRLAMLFHDMGKAPSKTTDERGIDHFYRHAIQSEIIAKKILKRLKFDNETIYYVTKLVRHHDDRMIPPNEYTVRRAVCRIGRDIFPLILQVQAADMAAQSNYMRKEKMENLNIITQCYDNIIENGDCIGLDMLAIKGSDLIDMGVPEGKRIGELLEKLLQIVLETPECNTKEFLERKVQELIL